MDGAARPGPARARRLDATVAFALIAVSLLLAGIADAANHAPGWRFPAAAAGSVVVAGWTLVMLRGSANAAPTTRRLVLYFVVRLVLTAALVLINPWFGVYAWYGYMEAIGYFAMPRALAAIAGTALIAATSYLGGFPVGIGSWVLYLVIVAGSTLLVGAIGQSVLRNVEQQAERDRMMADLVEANRRLADALAENRGPQNQLVTQDDGVGFSPQDQEPSAGGHAVGLETMRDRLSRVGGDLQIESEPGRGTALVARVPFHVAGDGRAMRSGDRRLAGRLPGTAGGGR